MAFGFIPVESTVFRKITNCCVQGNVPFIQKMSFLSNFTKVPMDFVIGMARCMLEVNLHVCTFNTYSQV